MSEKIALVLGAGGQLGQEIKAVCDQYPELTFYFANRGEIDVTAFDLTEMLEYHRPSVVINCAAYTAVDKAEVDEEKAYAINAKACQSLAEACSVLHASLIHISTDYVYHIEKAGPLTEDDDPKPKSVYAHSKAQGEAMIRQKCPSHIIIRTSWLYSTFGHNFVKTMLKLGKDKDQLSIVADQWGAPTYARDLAHAVCKIASDTILSTFDPTKYGTYNYANEGVVSWYDFAKTIFELSDIDIAVTKTTTKQFGAPAPRPLWSVMAKKKIRNAFGIEIPHWRQSLSDMLQRLEH